MAVHTHRRNRPFWLVGFVLLVLLLVLFARKVTQLALPGLGVSPKTAVIEPKCPTPEQKEVIEKNMNVSSNIT